MGLGLVRAALRRIGGFGAETVRGVRLPVGMAAPDAKLLGRVVTADRAAVGTDRLASPTEGFEVLAGLVVVLRPSGAFAPN